MTSTPSSRRSILEVGGAAVAMVLVALAVRVSGSDSTAITGVAGGFVAVSLYRYQSR